jgi:acetate kinase
LAILAVNGGSSSLKCSLFGDGQPQKALLLEFHVSDIFGAPCLKVSDPENGQIVETKLDLTGVPDHERHAGCMRNVLDWVAKQGKLPDLQAIGHRVVHGGDLFDKPVIIDQSVIGKLKSLVSLAPLHQPANITLIEACLRALPEIPQCACFDTMFHQHQETRERDYALPGELTRAGIHRYGFHGLSYEYITRNLRQLDVAYARQSIVIAHLGAGASLCAVKSGRSVATTMGFSTLDGLPMGSRCGSIDPGILIYLMREKNMDADTMEDLLYRRSGWLGISGVSADMLELRASADPMAKQAIDQFSYRIIREIGSLVAAMGGINCLVFTGGIGENDAALRQAVADGCAWLSLSLNDVANQSGRAVISDSCSKIEVRVMPCSEASMIAYHTSKIFKSASYG